VISDTEVCSEKLVRVEFTRILLDNDLVTFEKPVGLVARQEEFKGGATYTD